MNRKTEFESLLELIISIWKTERLNLFKKILRVDQNYHLSVWL